jgi:predicted NAD-dependent protein-ADP-ribosyltransferase YbiA (DUF1768 family)
MRDLTAVEGKIRDWLRAHHGVISRKEAHALGATDAMIRAKVRRGEWKVVHTAVFRDMAVPTTEAQTLRAACLAAGDHAVASHASAAWLWGLIDRAPGKPEVTVPWPRQHGRRAKGIALHQSKDLNPPAVAERRMIPVTTPLRTLVDMGASVSTKQLAAALDRALANKLVTIPAVLAELKRLGKRGRAGVGALRQVLTERGFINVPHPSVLESKTQRLFTRNKLPFAQCELVTGANGEYRLDFAYPEIKLAIEVDGYVWHFSPEHKQRDDARRNALILDGWRILVYSWRDITQNPNRVAREIAAAYRSAAAA